MTQKQRKNLANDIATAILTVNDLRGPVECTRAQMMLGKYPKEKNMGGRNKQSLIECIETELWRVKA